MIMNRVWQMPNKNTFKIPAIRQLIEKYVIDDGKGWIDPFCNESTYAEITNDLNPAIKSTYNLKAEEFAKVITGKFKGVLFDPPYSNRQIKECYEGVGFAFSQEDAQGLFNHEKKLFAPKIELGGLAMCFGWNSGGFGKNLGFEMIELLLVCHGGVHNDTIVTVERKFRETLFD